MYNRLSFQYDHHCHLVFCCAIVVGNVFELSEPGEGGSF